MEALMATVTEQSKIPGGIVLPVLVNVMNVNLLATPTLGTLLLLREVPLIDFLAILGS